MEKTIHCVVMISHDLVVMGLEKLSYTMIGVKLVRIS